jgi:hypothetical protein
MDSDSEVKSKSEENVHERESYDKVINESDHHENHNSSTNYSYQKNEVNYFDKALDFLNGFGGTVIIILATMYFMLPSLLPNNLISKIMDPKSISVGNASQLIMKSLRSPSSFHLVSGEEVWTGKDKKSKPAHIVRIEYDAQNGFGAMIRDCKLVAYVDEDGNKFSWNEFFVTNSCENELGQNALETLKEFNDFN